MLRKVNTESASSVQKVGNEGETIAAEYLEKNGMAIVAQNFQYFGRGRGRKGEIDIIAIDQSKKILKFVEVKTRKNRRFGQGFEQITRLKINSLRGAIEYFLMKNKQFETYNKQIDIISIDGNSEITWIQNAITFDT